MIVIVTVVLVVVVDAGSTALVTGDGVGLNLPLNTNGGAVIVGVEVDEESDQLAGAAVTRATMATRALIYGSDGRIVDRLFRLGSLHKINQVDDSRRRNNSTSRLGESQLPGILSFRCLEIARERVTVEVCMGGAEKQLGRTGTRLVLKWFLLLLGEANCPVKKFQAAAKRVQNRYL